ncbi:MAG: hypothetical protein ABFD60_07760 [Bryobacteraceae bacterium]
MTMQSEDYRKDYTSTGVASYAYTWRILDEEWLAVYVDGELQTLNSDYTVSGVGENAGGEVTFSDPPVAGLTIAIMPSVPITQTTDIVENTNLPAQTFEDALDKLTAIAKQHEERLNRFGLDEAGEAPVLYARSNVGSTAPAAPAAGGGKIYLKSSGGKMQFVALFPSGVEQVIATEP